MTAAAVAAIVACVDREGRLLVVKQLSGPFAGAWLMPGGAALPDESVEGAARRELAEETGYRVRRLDAVATYQVRSIPAGGFDIHLHMFRGDGIEGEARAEVRSEVRWADIREIDLHPSLALQLHDLGLLRRGRDELLRDLARIGVESRRIA